MATKKTKSISVEIDDCVNNDNRNKSNTGYTLESSNDAKREKQNQKRRSYTYEEKLKIVNLAKVRSKEYVCDKFKIDGCLLNKWIKNLSDIQQLGSHKISKNLKKKRSTNNNEVDKELYTWFLSVRENKMPISGIVLKEKAIEISKELGVKEFKASNGWLANWKNKHDVRLLRITGEKLSADVNAASEYPKELADTIRKENLIRDQVFNMDETVLRLKLLPGLTFVESNELDAPSFAKDKSRITISACSNANGSLKLQSDLVIRLVQDCRRKNS